MKFDLAIKNGTLITPDSTVQADIGIAGEEIAAIGRGLSGRREIDAAGCLVTPGAIDVHVHLQMPIGRFTSADDFFTGSRAAAFGGTTAFIDFVEAQPAEPFLDALAARQALAAPKTVIDYGLHMTIGPQDMDKLAQIPAVVKAGCASFKLYMAYGLRLTDGQLMQALAAISGANGLPVIHAENWDVIQTMIAQNLALGRTDPHWHPRSRPALLEGEAAERAIALAELTSSPLYIFHVGCQAVVDRVTAARQRGLPITAETCPQYLLLDDSVLDRPGVEGALPVCSPPLRPAKERANMWRALAKNHLQVVSTDHCPFTRAEKATGLGNFSAIPGGVPAIEARFPLLYTFGVRAGHLSAQRWVETCCTTPARLFGFERKGVIAVGYDADLVVFDPEREVTISPQTLHESAGWTPYEGLAVTGWPAVTISRGSVLVENGRFTGQAGQGKFVVRRITPAD